MLASSGDGGTRAGPARPCLPVPAGVLAFVIMRIVLIAAQSLDGFITRHDEPGTAFTSPEDKAHFRAALAAFDACIFGAETYRISRVFIRAQFPDHPLRIVLTRSPERFAADQVPGELEFTSATAAAVAGP